MAQEPEGSNLDPTSIERILPGVYDALRVLAHRKLLSERRGHTLQTTELVHETYLRLSQGDPRWANDAHFYRAAAEAMRRILIERARRRARLKHGGGLARVDIDENDIAVGSSSEDIIAISEALDELEKYEPRIADVVRLRFFVGFTIEETAEKLAISPATVKNDWAFARAWLQRAIAESRRIGDGSG